MRLIKKEDRKANEGTITCDKHGEYEIRFADHFMGRKLFVNDFCPQCAKEQTELRNAEEEAYSINYEMERILRVKARAGVSKRNMNDNFDSFIAKTESQKLALSKAVKFKDSILDKKDTPSLILTGKVGTGKTLLANCIVSSLVEKNKKVKIIKLIDMIRKLKETWRRDSEKTELDAIEFYSNLDLLVIDEVGVNFGSDTEKLFIFDIIDGRYQNMKPTMILSNLSMEGVKDSLGERCIDRLREGGGSVVALDWESFRK